MVHPPHRAPPLRAADLVPRVCLQVLHGRLQIRAGNEGFTSEVGPLPFSHLLKPSQTFSHLLQVPLKLHTFHAVSPLRLRVWVEGESYERAMLHGHIDLLRPAGQSEHFEMLVRH